MWVEPVLCLLAAAVSDDLVVDHLLAVPAGPSLGSEWVMVSQHLGHAEMQTVSTTVVPFQSADR